MGNRETQAVCLANSVIRVLPNNDDFRITRGRKRKRAEHVIIVRKDEVVASFRFNEIEYRTKIG